MSSWCILPSKPENDDDFSLRIGDGSMGTSREVAGDYRVEVELNLILQS